MNEFETRFERRENVIVITILSPRIAAENSAAFDEQIARPTQSIEKPNVVIDFSNVRFLTSATLGKLIKLNGRIGADQHGQLKLCSLDQRIAEVFRITGLEQLFQIYPTCEDAMKSFP